MEIQINTLKADRKTTQIVAVLLVVGAVIFLFSSVILSARTEYIEVGDTAVDHSDFVASKVSEKDLDFVMYEPVKIDIAGITADGIYIYNPENFQVFAVRNYQTKYHIASLTKLMTALVVLDYYDLDDEFVASGDVYLGDYSKIIGLKDGDIMTVRDGLSAMLVGSYNDVAEAFGNSIEGGYDEFLQAMNQKAHEYGMSNTNFSSTSGLIDKDNYSTPRDLQKLVYHFMREEYLADLVNRPIDKIKYRRPIIIDQVDKKNDEELALESVEDKAVAEYEEHELIIYTTNRLLEKVDGVVGLKTGYTNWAGQCYISYFIDDVTGEKMVYVLLDSNARFEEAEILIKRSMQN